MSSDNNKKNNDLAERRRQQILAAATKIFARNGFARTTIDDIADHLNIGKGTVYRYFKNKKSLFLAVYEHGMQDLRHAFDVNVQPISNPQIKQIQAVRTYFEFFDSHLDLIEIMMQVRSEFKDHYSKISIAMYKDYIVRIQKNLLNGIKMGIFRELDIEKTADAISATLQGILQDFYIRQFTAEKTNSSNDKKESLADRTDAVTALLLSGLLKS